MNSCLFCKILRKEIPADIVYEDDEAIVIKDIEPQAPIHWLAIPKEHFAGVQEVPDDNNILNQLFNMIGKVVQENGLAAKGYRLVINYGEKAGQSVPHIHVHILSGRALKWPPG